MCLFWLSGGETVEVANLNPWERCQQRTVVESVVVSASGADCWCELWNLAGAGVKTYHRAGRGCDGAVGNSIFPRRSEG